MVFEFCSPAAAWFEVVMKDSHSLELHGLLNNKYFFGGEWTDGERFVSVVV